MIFDVAVGVFLGMLAFSLLPLAVYFLFFAAAKTSFVLSAAPPKKEDELKAQAYDKPVPSITKEQQALVAVVAFVAFVMVAILVAFLIVPS